MIVDQKHARAHSRLSSNVTSVPSPGVDTMTALPPLRVMRWRIDSAMPRRSSGTWVVSKPRPTIAHEGRETVGLRFDVQRDGFDAGVLRRVHRGFARRLQQPLDARVDGALPTVTTSTSMSCSSSTSATMASTAAASVPLCPFAVARRSP